MEAITKLNMRKSKKGFTLVELIVVLIILAILAALLIPTLTGYIDKANEKKAIAEARMVLMAAQTVAGETYAKVGHTLTTSDTISVGDVVALAEMPTGATFTVTVKADGSVETVTYGNGLYKCTYNKTAGTKFVPDKSADKPTSNTIAVG